MSNEKRFPASSRKRRRRREQGDLAKSSNLSAGIALFVSLHLVFWLIEQFQIVSWLLGKTFSAGADFHSNHMLLSLTAASLAVSVLVLAPLAVAGLVGVVIEVSQVGLHVLPSQLFRIDRLSVLSGLRRIFGLRPTASGSWAPVGIPAEICKLLIYLLVLALVTGGCMIYSLGELLYFEFRTIDQVLTLLLGFVSKIVVLSCSLWGGFGCIELLLSRRQRERRLRMTRDEFQRETRESEGDPHLAGIRKQMHQEIGMHRVVEQVRRANAVVVN